MLMYIIPTAQNIREGMHFFLFFRSILFFTIWKAFYWNYSPYNARVATDNGFNSCHRDGFSQYVVCHLQAKELVFGSKNRACACAFVYYGNNMSLGQWYSICFFVFLEKKMNRIFLHLSLFLIIIIKIIKFIINLFFAYLKKKGKIKNVVILRNAVAFCDEQPEI